MSTDKPYKRSSPRKILILGATSTIALALALGIGLGVGLRNRSSSSDSSNDNGNSNSDSSPTSPSTPSPTPTFTARPLWRPRVNDTWQIILSSAISLDKDATSVTPDVSIYDLDLFETPPDTIATLHRLGKKVICYFSGGSYEPNRPDSSDFAEEDKGKVLDGWPDERWIRLGSERVGSVMRGRVELAREKGCDGVDPDNVDGYQNENGLDLTQEDSVDFMTFLSNVTAPLNLTLGLKNAGDIIPSVLPMVHFSVNEQCVQYQECDTFSPFIDAGKPVFHIEYPDGAGDTTGIEKPTAQKYCGRTGDAQGSDEFSTVLKKMDLDGWVEYCDGEVQSTSVASGSE